MTASRRDESDDRVAPEEGARASELRAARAPLDAPTVVSGQGSSTRRLVSPTTRETPSPHYGAVLVPPAGAVTTPAPVVQPAGSGSSLSRALPLPSPGDRIDVFVLEESIGVGGMGAVFRALDTRLDRHVALKILPPEQADDPEVSRRFQLEGRAAARLDHENIARVYTIGFDAGYYFIAFEFIEGETIRRRVEREGVLPPGEAINYTLQIAHALIHAVERGVVHRDIKPSNIVITPQGRAKLVDMGLARRFERGGDDGMTQSGMTLGTFDYISPEQARDPRDVDVRSDLYSLGCTLFHMVTGRPPFPDGTVLQKLIQHQEEPPPDPRALNPAVPVELAAIVLKLMAKDRDRRYQSPEQLVRDLLSVASSLGLRSSSPEGLVWTASPRASRWEKHLAWGVPTLAFALIVGGLLWFSGDWGRSSGRSGVARSGGGTAVVRGDRAPVVEDVPSPPPSSEPNASRASEKAEAGNVLPTPTQVEIGVESSDDLGRAIATAPAGATILLLDDGPYELRGAGSDRFSPRRLTGRELTVKAELGVRPVLVGRLDASDEPGLQTTLLDFADSRVNIEGVTFALVGEDGEAAAIRVENTELTLRRCLFERTGDLKLADFPAAVVVIGPPAGDDRDRPPGVVLDACHFEGAQAAVRGRGPIDLLARDCTFAARGGDVVIESKRPGSNLRLSHTTILVADQAALQFVGIPPRVRIDDSVIAAAPGSTRATLVVCEDPVGLDWRGRDNLYAGLAVFAATHNGRAADASNLLPTTLEAWSRLSGGLREVGERALPATAVWLASDPLVALDDDRDNPGLALRIRPEVSGEQMTGARRGPFGRLIAAPTRAASAAVGPPEALAPPTRYDPVADLLAMTSSPSSPVRSGRTDDSSETGRAQPSSPIPSPPAAASTRQTSPPSGNAAAAIGSKNEAPKATAAAPGVARPTPPDAHPTQPNVAERAPNAASVESEASAMPPMSTMPVMPPMRVDPEMPTDRGSNPPATTAEPATPPASEPTKSGTAAPVNTDRPRRVTVRDNAVEVDNAAVRPPQDVAVGEVVRDQRRFLRLLERHRGDRVVITVASDADWEIPPFSLSDAARCRIVAERGATRPRFTPVARERSSKGDPDAFVWADLKGGTLAFEGIDLYFAASREGAGTREPIALAGLDEGAELILKDATMTLRGDGKLPAFARVRSAESTVVRVTDRFDAGPKPASRLRILDSMLRSGGDLIVAQGGCRLDAELLNVVVATDGSLLTARGLAAGLTAEPIALTLSRVTARRLAGLARLTAGPAEPVPPILDIVARDCILASSHNAPLIEVDGQDDLASLADRVRWKGKNITYHRVAIYRRDQSTKVGALPRLYDRESWSIAVGTRDEGASHSDVAFRRVWTPDRATSEFVLEDAAIPDDSAASGRGADLHVVPEPPSLKTF